MKQPFHEWIADTRRQMELRQEDCAERVSRAFPTKRVRQSDGTWREIPAMTRQGWNSYERYPAKRVSPDTVKKVAVGLGLSESQVAEAAEYSFPSSRMDVFRSTLSGRLRSAREGRYTQEELGRKTGLGRDAIASYENNRAEPPAVALCLIAEALDADMNVLCGLEPGEVGVQPRPPSESRGLECLLQSLHDTMQEGFNRLAAENRSLRHLLESR